MSPSHQPPARPADTGAEAAVTVTSSRDTGADGHPRSADHLGLPRRFGRNVTMNYLALATTALSSLLLTPVLLHSLGRSAYGVWTLAGGVIAYLELLELGFGRATTKMIAEDVGRRPDSMVRTLNTNVTALAGLGVVAFAAGLVIALAAPTLFDIPQHLRGESVAMFTVLAVALAVSIPFDSFGGALAAHQRYDLLAATNIGLVAASTLVIIGIVAAGGDIVALAIGTAAVSFPFHVLRWRLLRHLAPGMRLSRRFVERDRLKEAARLSWWFLMVDVAVTLTLKIDLIVVGLLFGVRTVAVYAVGSKAAQLFLNAMTGLVQVYFPQASFLGREGRRDDLRLLVTDGTRTALLVSLPLTAILVILAHPAVRLWVGPGYGESARILTVLTLAMAVRSMATTSSTVLQGSGRERAVATTCMAEAVVNVTMSVILGLLIGPIGVAFGTLIGAAVVQVPWMVALSYRVTDMKLSEFVGRSLVPHVVPAAVGAAVFVTVRALISGAAGPLLVVVIAAVAAYLATYLLASATPAERRRLREALAAIGFRPTATAGAGVLPRVHDAPLPPPGPSAPAPHPAPRVGGVSRRDARALGSLLELGVVEHDGATPPNGLVEQLEGADLRGLPAAARYHRVTGYVVRNLREVTLVPAEVRQALVHSYRVGVSHHLRVMAALDELRTSLASVDVRWLLVKGPVLGELYYKDPGLRPYADLDVVVPPAELPEVVHRLEEAGFGSLDRNWSLIRSLGAGEVHLMSPQQVEVDLHWHLLFGAEQRRTFPVDMEGLFEHAREVEIRGARLWTTDPVDTLVHLCLHGAVEGGDQLIWLKDIERVLALDRPDWDEVVRRAQAARAALPVVAMLGRARAALGAEVPDDVLAMLCPSSAYRAFLRALDRRFPASSSNGRGSPLTLVTRACRQDLHTTAAEAAVGIARRMGRLARSGSWAREVPGNDPRHPGSLRHATGDEQDREAFMKALRTMGD